jgi:hypothetical protein
VTALAQASFLGFARSILGGKKKGAAGCVENIKEGQPLQVRCVLHCDGGDDGGAC